MKVSYLHYPFLFFCLFAFAGCSSSVQLADVQKQETEAREELAELEEELMALATLKEQYSKDSKMAELAALRKRKADIKTEIANLKKVKDSDNSSVVGSVEQAIATLEDESKKVDASIAALEAMPAENWSSSKDSIQLYTSKLQGEVDRITASLKASGAQ